jgi:arabinofuranan 3-O-arabinosyltransferase
MVFPAEKVLGFILLPRTRYILAWLVAIVAAGGTLSLAWIMFDSPRRADGTYQRRDRNRGHVMIDFGGQWLMGRMVALGLGSHLYDRSYLRPVLREAYPKADEVPEEDRPPEEKGTSDVENLMTWMMGTDEPQTTSAKQIGGALYPPIHALLMAPLGFLPPAAAYRVVQIAGVLLAFVCGWQIRSISDGRIWWPVASTAIMVFPGFSNTLNLGQNSILTLALLMIGWSLIARKRPILGGCVWGCLAFKPTWAVSFLFVAFLSRRWRVCMAMMTTGACLILATLPFVGWDAWLDWLQVGNLAAQLYKTDRNWIFLSRDLLSIPRRWLIDFKAPLSESADLTCTIIGCIFLVLILEPTIRLAAYRSRQSGASTGPIPAFLLLAGWFSCFHFMYYDVLLTALPISLLLLNPAEFLKPRLIALVPLQEGEGAEGFRPDLQPGYPIHEWPRSISSRQIVVLNSVTLSLIALLFLADHVGPALDMSASISATMLKGPIEISTGTAGTPWVTFCLMMVWAWCGYLWMKIPDKSSPEAAKLV